VTGYIKAFRSGTFQYKQEKGDRSDPPQSVYLFESTDENALPWAYWTLENLPPMPNGAVANLADPCIVTTTTQYENLPRSDGNLTSKNLGIHRQFSMCGLTIMTFLSRSRQSMFCSPCCIFTSFEASTGNLLYVPVHRKARRAKEQHCAVEIGGLFVQPFFRAHLLPVDRLGVLPSGGQQCAGSSVPGVQHVRRCQPHQLSMLNLHRFRFWIFVLPKLLAFQVQGMFISNRSEWPSTRLMYVFQSYANGRYIRPR
jgi:hypothetical protein